MHDAFFLTLIFYFGILLSTVLLYPMGGLIVLLKNIFHLSSINGSNIILSKLLMIHCLTRECNNSQS